MSEKYLILGASSFYGSSFTKYLEKIGHEVLTLSRPQWYLGQNSWLFAEADYIINFASQSLVAESWEAPDVWMDANATKTALLFDQVRGLKNLKRFIHVSTPEVYGHREQKWKEGKSFNPSTPYAVSRAAGDMMLLAYHKAYDLPAIITRTANIYGPGQPDWRFIPKAFKALKAGEKIELHGAGGTRRGWIHIDDACSATYRIIQKGLVGETYHIAPKEIYSVYDVAWRICEVAGKTPQHSLIMVPDRLGKDQCYWLDSQQLRNLGWKDRITLDEGLRECASAI